MEKPKYTNLVLAGVVVLWMIFAFATIQHYGASLSLMGATFGILIASILMLFGHRVTYLRIGNRLVVGMETPHDREVDEHANHVPDEQEQGRR